MFNFTTQTVYNFINDSQGDPKRNLWVSGGPKPALRIGNTRFDAADILDVQTKNPSDESLASVTFDMADVLLAQDSTENEATGRIVLYLGLSMNSQDALYANDLVYKGKPIFVEFPIKKDDTAALVAERVKAIANKYLLFLYGEKILNIVAEEGKVTISGVNGYQQIKLAKLQKFDPTAKALDCCTSTGEYVDVKIGVPVIYTISNEGKVNAGEEGQEKVFDDVTENGRALAANEVAILTGLEAFCDYNWIIHNLRLPTAANTNFWAPTRLEMPAVGQQYTQFIIRICKERDGIVGEIVGARAKSVTTHVLYVAGKVSDNTSAAYKVSQAINTLVSDASKKLTDADTKLATPFVEVFN